MGDRALTKSPPSSSLRAIRLCRSSHLCRQEKSAQESSVGKHTLTGARFSPAITPSKRSLAGTKYSPATTSSKHSLLQRSQSTVANSTQQLNAGRPAQSMGKSKQARASSSRERFELSLGSTQAVANLKPAQARKSLITPPAPRTRRWSDQSQQST